MACIIKLPEKKNKGVVSITNIELKKIKNLELIKELKKKWILLYHPNYYDYNFYNKKIFDGFLAWKDTFNVIDEKKDKVFDLTCHNFAPKHFKFTRDKMYDFVGLSKLQTSDGNPKYVLEFLKLIKETMKLKKDLTGVLIISVPGLRPFKTNNIRNIYNKMFTNEEKKKFEFITLDYDFPQALSTKTISMFYKNSKIHINTHPKERHGRAQTYALACGLPIVGFKNLSFLVPKNFRKKPYYFISNEFNELPKKIIKALRYVDKNYKLTQHQFLGKYFTSELSLKILKKKLIKKFNLNNKKWNFKDDWDIRLAKHHIGHSTKNTYHQTIEEFMEKLLNLESLNFFDEAEDDIMVLKNKNIFFVKMRSLKYTIDLNINRGGLYLKNLLRKFFNNLK